MTTLIEVRNSDGVVGRCDANCYEAAHPECHCVCGGKNHGAGLERATDNTRELAQSWLKEYADREGLKDYEAVLGLRVVQRGLFE